MKTNITSEVTYGTGKGTRGQNEHQGTRDKKDKGQGTKGTRDKGQEKGTGLT